jgi:hypothetical protein
MDVLENDFGEVDEAMSHEFERTFKRIFYILSIEKSNVDKVAELMI